MLKRSKYWLQQADRGFTVVELMIATATFGLVLLVIATAILQLSRVYYKGITETKVQTTTRTLVDSIAQAVQFSGAPITNSPAGATAGSTVWTFCVGNQQYAYRLGQQLVDNSPGANQTTAALRVRDVPGCTSSSPVPATPGRELLAPGMRLARMEVSALGGPFYKVSARVVFGDDDLLSSPTATSAQCKNNQRVGTQFCAVSDITAGVTKRVN
jgi:Tfp pilus assembly protein FimT